MKKIPKAPCGFGPSGKAFWKKINSEFEIEAEHDYQRLKIACHSLDEISEAKKAIVKDGRFIRDRFEQSREHPALKTIRDFQIVFLRAVRELNLSTEPEETRPPRIGE